MLIGLLVCNGLKTVVPAFAPTLGVSRPNALCVYRLDYSCLVVRDCSRVGHPIRSGLSMRFLEGRSSLITGGVEVKLGAVNARVQGRSIQALAARAGRATAPAAAASWSTSGRGIYLYVNSTNYASTWPP